MPLPLSNVFADLPDPRRDTANKRHELSGNRSHPGGDE